MHRTASLLIADDLTGACDAAVQFARRGLRSVTALQSMPSEGEAQVLAISTESRDIDAAAIPALFERVAADLAMQDARVIFKKIDSTLRGHAGREVAAALEAFQCDAAVIAPSFPAMARVVENGRLRVTSDASFEPIEIAVWLRSQGVDSCTHLTAAELQAALDAGARFVSLEANCEADLARIVEAGLASGRRLLWAGSAGLASALAGALSPVEIPPATHAKSPRGVLLGIGSDHAVTLEQQRQLLERRPSLLLHFGDADVDCLSRALEKGTHVVLRLPRGRVALHELRELLAGARPAALVLSGGDTASLVCSALGTASIELRQEIAPGIPEGILEGGLLSGLPVVTKSGGFGSPDGLIRVADHYHE